MSPLDERCSFDTETLEPDEDGIEQRFKGTGRIGHTVAVSLVAPFALVGLNQYEIYENGSRSEPGIEFPLFDLDWKRLDPAQHFLEAFGEESMQILAEQRGGIIQILETHGLTVLADADLDRPVPWLRAGGDVLRGSTAGPLTVRDVFFFEVA